MRDLSADAALLSLNTITVREQWSLAECIEGCVRHSIGGISPWRDKLEEVGAGEAARRIGDAGLTVTGLCRGGMFPAADAAGRHRPGPPNQADQRGKMDDTAHTTRFNPSAQSRGPAPTAARTVA